MNKKQINKKIGASLKRLRQKSNMNQTMFGALVGKHQAAWCRIENGQQSISLAEAVILAKYLNINIEDTLS